MIPGRDYLAAEARAALFGILHGQAVSFAQAAASWRTQQQTALHTMQVTLHALRSSCGLLQLKRSSVYCASAQAVLRQAVRSCDQEAAARLLQYIGQTLQSCTALWNCFPAAAEESAAGLIGVHSLNRLRGYLGRNPLEAAGDEALCLALARLAAVSLRELTAADPDAPRSDLIRELLDRPEAGLQAGEPARSALSHTLVAGIREAGRPLQQSARNCDEPGKTADLQQPDLYRIVCCMEELRQVATVAGLPLLSCFSQLPAALVWHLLRSDLRADTGQCLGFLQELMILLQFLVPLELQVREPEPKEPLSEPLASGSGSVLVRDAQQRLARLLQGTARQTRLDVSLAQLLRQETSQTAGEFLAFAQMLRQADGVIPARLCTLAYKLALNLATAGDQSSQEKCASLQLTMNLMMEQRTRAGEPIAAVLEEFVHFAVQRQTGADALETPCGFDRLDHRLLLLECASLRQLSPDRQHKTGPETKGSHSELPLYLASNIRFLPSAEGTLAAAFQAAVIPPARIQSLLAPLVRELQLLASGARALKVYRVEALAAAMLEIYQQVLQTSEACSDQRWQQLVLRSHRQLRQMLNQAAAHQEVKSARPLIAALYHWLENASQPGEDDWQIYRLEVRQLLETIVAGMSHLLHAAGDDGQVNPSEFTDAAPALLRALHTLKGTAGLHDQDALVQACHAVEAQVLILASDPATCTRGCLEEMLAVLEGCSELENSGNRVAECADGSASYRARSPLACREIRVPAAALQHFSNLLRVCTVNQQRLSRLCAAAHQAPSMSTALRETLAVQTGQLGRLERLLLEVRQARVDRYSRRCTRLVAKIGNAENRQVRFEMCGGELLLERALLDYLQHPLEHLLRNAICHGIEAPELRRSCGKPETGLIRLEASIDRSTLRLSLSDDGGGIDPAEVEHRARALGLQGSSVHEAIPAVAASSPPGLRWLFAPGFSMRAEVDTRAGRGIGLDAVQRAVEAIGGQVSVRSQPGSGSCFTLSVPSQPAT